MKKIEKKDLKNQSKNSKEDKKDGIFCCAHCTTSFFGIVLVVFLAYVFSLFIK